MRRIVPTLFVLLFTATSLAAEILPDQIAHDATDKIVSLLKTNKEVYNKDHAKLYAMVDELVLPYFDFRAMSRTVLGRYWRTAEEPQRARFTQEFRNLLVRTYSTALLKYNDEKIIYLPFRLNPEDRTVTVRSEIRSTDGTPPISIQYSFYRTDEGWKVYDVTIEGASLVTTYQSTYATSVQRDGLDALIARLVEDNKAGVTAKPVPIGAANSGVAK